MTDTVAIVLAAGKGTRMGSDRAKVLHELAGKPLVTYPISAALAAGADAIVVVVGHQAQAVRDVVTGRFASPAPRFATQAQQLGTGHAVLCAMEEVDATEGLAFVLSGDVPLLTSDTLGRLGAACRGTEAGLAFATFRPEDPTGYGRVQRDGRGRVVAIVEQRDADERQRAIDECNAGTYAIDLARLRADLPRLGRANAQGEMYLTDLVAFAAARGPVGVVEVGALEAAGVNTRQQLQALEDALQGV